MHMGRLTAARGDLVCIDIEDSAVEERGELSQARLLARFAQCGAKRI
jgi:hypothetical protein